MFPSEVEVTGRRIFGTDRYYACTVCKHGNENTISDYAKKQGKYQKLYEDRQLSLFEYPGRLRRGSLLMISTAVSSCFGMWGQNYPTQTNKQRGFT